MTRVFRYLVIATLIALSSAAFAQLSGTVNVSMRTIGDQVFFDPVGVWVEPGTTIRFLLIDGVHDTQAFHPDNPVSLGLNRIPEGAQPWNSGMMGGLINPSRTFEVTLTEEGVYDYFCSPHVAFGMVGRIVVGNPEASPAKPVDEIMFEPARAALPSVEDILAQTMVHSPLAPPMSAAQDAVDTTGLLAEVRAAAGANEIAFWGGRQGLTTEPFRAGGEWRISLGTSCFEGIGFVRVIVRDAAGAEVNRFEIIGDGTDSLVMNTEPGEFTLEVVVSHWHIYTWEILVESLSGPPVAEGGGAGGNGGTVEEQAWAGNDVFTTPPFAAEGAWEVILGAWCHDGVSFARATIYDAAGAEVDQVTVIAQGTGAVTVTTPPGEYTVKITSPNMDVYHWELLVRPASEN
jgi:plastocyanin